MDRRKFIHTAGSIGVGTIGLVGASLESAVAAPADDNEAIEQHIRSGNIDAAIDRAEEADINYQRRQGEYTITVSREEDDGVNTQSLISEDSVWLNLIIVSDPDAIDRHNAYFAWDADVSNSSPFYSGNGDSAALFWSNYDFRGVAGTTDYWSNQEGMDGSDLLEARHNNDLLTSSAYQLEFDSESPCISACSGGESWDILTEGGIRTDLEERSGASGDATIAGEYAHAYSFVGTSVSFSAGNFSINVSTSGDYFKENETINYSI